MKHWIGQPGLSLDCMFQLHSAPWQSSKCVLSNGCGSALLNLRAKYLCTYFSNNDSRWQNGFKTWPRGVCVNLWRKSAQAALLCSGLSFPKSDTEVIHTLFPWYLIVFCELSTSTVQGSWLKCNWCPHISDDLPKSYETGLLDSMPCCYFRCCLWLLLWVRLPDVPVCLCYDWFIGGRLLYHLWYAHLK